MIWNHRPQNAKASERGMGIRWRLYHLQETHGHGFLQEGWGYAVGLILINRHEADSYRLGPKTGFLSRGIGWPGIEEEWFNSLAAIPGTWVYLNTRTNARRVILPGIGS